MAIYCRLSGYNPAEFDRQIARVKGIVSRIGFRIFDLYLDHGKKGHVWTRRRLLDLKRDAEHGCFTVVVFWNVARLTRDPDLWDDLWSFFVARKIHAISLVDQEGVNTLTSTAADPWSRRAASYRNGKRVATVEKGLREGQCMSKAEEVQERRTNGQSVGGGQGYSKAKREEMVRRARDMIARGKVRSLDQAAPYLSVGKSSLYRWAKDFPRVGRGSRGPLRRR